MEEQKQIAEKAKMISLRLILVALIFLLALLLFAFIADEMVLENENRLDFLAFQKLRQITNPTMTNIMVGITFFGSSYFLFPAYIVVILIFLFRKKQRRLSWNVLAVG